MLGLFVPTSTVSRRKQTWIVRLLCPSRSRNVIPLPLRLRFTGQLRQLFMFLVRPSSWASAEARPGHPGARRDGNSLRVGPRHEVSRKFLYQQVHTAEQALDVPSHPVHAIRGGPLLPAGYQAWLRQLVLALVFICQSSTRGVVELLRDVFDFRISLGTVHNIVHSPVAQARRINQQYDLSTIRHRPPR